MDTETEPTDISYEEGEIPHDDSELYTPLERPHIPNLVNQNQPLTTDSEDDNNGKELSSDSDSSEKRYPTKMRKKILHKEGEKIGIKKKNYNIWSADLQSDVLSNCLEDCNVDMLYERVRDVESYNYNLGKSNTQCQELGGPSIAEKCLEKNRYSGGKRKHNGACADVTTENKHSYNSKESKRKEGYSRNILGLSTTVNSSEDEIATDIANKLCEEKEELILKALTVLGKESVISLFDEVQKIEASGGMLIMNGARRRTPGGVFFYLIKTSEALPREKVNEVFAADKKEYAKNRKKTANEIKKLRAAKFKEALSKDDFPKLLSETGTAIKEFKAKRLAEESSEVANPPPSPATDVKDSNNETTIVDAADRGPPISYDDEFLEY